MALKAYRSVMVRKDPCNVSFVSWPPGSVMLSESGWSSGKTRKTSNPKNGGQLMNKLLHRESRHIRPKTMQSPFDPGTTPKSFTVRQSKVGSADFSEDESVAEVHLWSSELHNCDVEEATNVVKATDVVKTTEREVCYGSNSKRDEEFAAYRQGARKRQTCTGR